MIDRLLGGLQVDGERLIAGDAQVARKARMRTAGDKQADALPSPHALSRATVAA